MSVKNSKTINFIRKNAYYFAFIICLAVLTIITIALVVSYNKPNNGGTTIEKPNEDNNQNDNNGNLENKPSDDNNNDNNQNENEGNNNEEEQKPVVSVIVFDMPVNGTIIKDYVSAGVVYNQTLNLYSGHKAIDFAGEEGAVVKAVYGGTIESVVTSKLEGVTVTIDHGNGLKSVYNSIDVNEDIITGKTVNKGDDIGVISTNNKLEYKDGAHLHFEVLENGEKIDPYKYLLTEEK
jgi:murein DD-endopeptidase MepM/ murein hydrolase activator NlpD